MIMLIAKCMTMFAIGFITSLAAQYHQWTIIKLIIVLSVGVGAFHGLFFILERNL